MARALQTEQHTGTKTTHRDIQGLTIVGKCPYIQPTKLLALSCHARSVLSYKPLGVKQSTTNWAVLRECGHEPLQFYWFRSAVKLFNSMLNTNSDTLRRVVQADLNFFFFFWWGLLHGPQQGPQQGPDRMKEKKTYKTGKRKTPA